MTATDDFAIMRKIRLIKKHASQLSQLTPSDSGIADACGLTREIEVILAKARRSWEQVAAAEMEPIWDHDKSMRVNQRDQSPSIAVGKQYDLVDKFKTTYSYNTPGILIGLAGESGTVVDALMLAVEHGAVRLNWQLHKLTSLLYEQDVDMVMTQREINDDEGPGGALVGKVKVKDGVTRVAIK